MVQSIGSLVAEAIEVHHAIQKEEELTPLAHAVNTLQPNVILEIGSDAGGTAWLWNKICPTAVIYCIDLPGGPYSTGERFTNPGVYYLPRDSHLPETRNLLIEHVYGRMVEDPKFIDFLFIDGDHTFGGVMADLMMYGPLVRDGGLVALHDILEHPGRPDVGVHRLWSMLGRDRGNTLAIVARPLTWGGIGIFTV